MHHALPIARRFARLTTTLVTLPALLASVACGGFSVSLTDDAGSPNDHALHMPWTVGAYTTVIAHPGAFAQAQGEWHGVILDESIAVIESQTESGGKYLMSVRALAEGETEIVVYADDSREVELARGELRVLMPDALEIASTADVLFLGDLETAPRLSGRLHVAVGGDAGFVTLLSKEGERLFGHGAVTVEYLLQGPGASIDAVSYAGEARDVLRVQPAGAVDDELVLKVAEVQLARIPLTTLNDTGWAELSVRAQSEAGRNEGDPLIVLCEGFMEDGTKVFGPSCSWSFNGTVQELTGDLARYSYAPESEATLSASFGVHSTAEGTVHATEIGVGTSAQLGCAQAPIGAIGGLALFLLLRRGRRRVLSSPGRA